MSSYRFIISGGGTGGHIYPAIAIADALKERYPQAQIRFVGAKNRMEMEKVPQAGYPIDGLWISGLKREFTAANLSFPLKLISSLWKSRSIIRSFKPHMAIGTGGYASGPLLRMAEAAGVPCVLQEQNSFAGITNKWLAPRAQKIFTAYEGMEKYFPAEKVVLTGNPVRKEMLHLPSDKEAVVRHFGLDPEKKVLFVMGGSQGAREINRYIAEILPELHRLELQVLWQCGKLYYEEYRSMESEGIVIRPFIQEMDKAYAAADVIVSRAGAGSVSELALVGKPVLFIPSPNVAEDHQTHNAKAIASKDAAVLIPESELRVRFMEVLVDLVSHPEKGEAMGAAFRDMARPEATERIVDEIEDILRKQNDKV